VGGQAFYPFSGPGRFTVPASKPVEVGFQNVIENYIAQTLRGSFARSYFQEPPDLRDYAYENSKIMALKGEVFYNNWPASCGTGGSGCNWLYYKTNRAYYIQQVQSIDFTDIGFPLQGKTGGYGYCVDKVEEFYGYAPSFSPTELIESAIENANVTGDVLFYTDDVVPSAGPHVYGVGVYTASESGVTTFWLTIIRVTLITSAPCECALVSCTV